MPRGEGGKGKPPRTVGPRGPQVVGVKRFEPLTFANLVCNLYGERR